eukprot:scaffold177554_cov26-Tisochrysis_lutea.AAC.1
MSTRSMHNIRVPPDAKMMTMAQMGNPQSRFEAESSGDRGGLGTNVGLGAAKTLPSYVQQATRSGVPTNALSSPGNVSAEIIAITPSGVRLACPTMSTTVTRVILSMPSRTCETTTSDAPGMRNNVAFLNVTRSRTSRLLLVSRRPGSSSMARNVISSAIDSPGASGGSIGGGGGGKGGG